MTRTARALAAPAALLAALVLAACAVATAAPAVAARWSTAALRQDVGVNALPSGREITLSWLGGPSGPAPQRFQAAPASMDGAWAALTADLDAVHAGMGADLRAATAPAEVVAVSARGMVGPSPSRPGAQTTQIALVAGPALADEVRQVAGTWPGPPDADGTLPVALSAAVAEAASWPVGETRAVTFGDGGSVDVVLAGTVDAADPADPVWGHTSGLVTPSYLWMVNGRILDAKAIVATDSWPAAERAAGQARTTAWFAVDTDALDAAGATTLAEQARSLTGGEPVAIGIAGGTATPTTRLPLVLDAFAGRQDVLTRLRAAAAAGPAAAGLATLALAALLVGRRLDATTGLLAARGASRPQVAAIRAGAVSIWVAPAAVAGVAAGAVATGAWHAGSLVVAAGLTLGCAAVVATPPLGRRTGAFARVAAASALVTACLVAVLVVVRGDGGDPALVLAAPVLALAAGLAAWRALLRVLRGLGRLGGSRRGLSGALGPARATSAGVAGGAALLALVLGVALAVFSGALLSTLRAGVGGAVREELGADLRVEADAGLGPDAVARVAETPGVRTAAAVGAARGTVARVGASTETVTVLVTDTARLAELTGGALPALPRPDAGGAVPVVASPWFASAVGTDDASIRGHALAPVTAPADTIALVTGRKWVIVDTADAQELLGRLPRPDLVLVALREDADPDAVAAALLATTDPAPTVVVARDQIAARLAGPDVAGLVATVVAAAVGSAVLAALALTTSVLLRSSGRRRLTGLLGAFGLRRGEARALVAWDAAPIAVAGVVVGAVAGVGLARFVVPATDLGAFTGAVGRGLAVISPGLTAALVALVAAAAAAVVVLAAFAVRDADPARALREMTGG